MSDAHDSSSPAPSSIPQIQIPDDSMIVRYESIDPTRVLDNPSHLFGNTFYDKHVDEKVGSVVGDLLTMYQKLSFLNASITIQNVKFDLQHDELKNAEIYDLLDKFYVDLPDINCVNSSWLNADTLSLVVDKQNLHKSIKENLKVLQTTLSTLGRKKSSNSKVDEHETDSEQDDNGFAEDEDEEVKPAQAPKQSKKTKNKRKK